ncbi:MAG: D-alanyl-D-alanine carboxypeptidase [Candidatus Caldatribacteriota bacterium]|nr:D-alanyl-D-alanine carboxypeptidase [Candidatus Caldatribacteriota bacterium]
MKLKYKVIILLFPFLIFTSLLICVAGADTDIREEINQFPGFAGVLIKDLNTHEVLFSHNEDKLFTPASLTKIFTLLAALEIFDEEQHAYPTSFYFSSTTPGEINGDLYIVGSGDPTQTPEVIRKIADALMQKFSIRHISGDIVLDNSKFLPEEFLGRGWMWDDKNPLIGALTVTGYKVKEKQNSYLDTMPLLWGNIFSQELSKKGVKIEGNIRIGKVQEDLRIKYVYYSDTLDKILAYMMKKSDNQSAENIFRTLAPEDNPEGSSTTIAGAIASLEEVIDTTLGLKWGKDYILVDGCGLSEYNLTTPAHLVKAITYLYRKYDFKILDYFASTKEKGTLKERLPFQVWGKTGTLSSASALAGLLETKNKKWVVFCLMENNFIFIEEENDPKIFENRIIEYIYEDF